MEEFRGREASPLASDHTANQPTSASSELQRDQQRDGGGKGGKGDAGKDPVTGDQFPVGSFPVVDPIGRVEDAQESDAEPP